VASNTLATVSPPLASIGSAPSCSRARQPVRHHVDGEDARRAVQLRALQGEHPDRPEPDDDDDVTGVDVGALRAEVPGGEDVGEEHGLLHGDALGILTTAVSAAGTPTASACRRGARARCRSTFVPALRQTTTSPARHGGQRPHPITPETSTRSPLVTVVTAEPTSSTVPTNSCPRCTPGIVIGPW
jgi:hypothetical protein